VKIYDFVSGSGCYCANNKVPACIKQAGFLFYAVFGHFSVLKLKKTETEKAKIINRKSRQKI